MTPDTQTARELREFTKCRTYPSVVWICKVFSCPSSCIPSRYYLPLWDTDKVTATATATAKRTKGQKDKNTKTNKRVYYCDIWALGNDLFILSVKCFDFMNWWVGQNQSFFITMSHWLKAVGCTFMAMMLLSTGEGVKWPAFFGVRCPIYCCQKWWCHKLKRG